MKKTSSLFVRILIYIFIPTGSILYVSCKKEYSLPIVEFNYSVKGNTVDFKADISNAESFTWDFGDGLLVENDTNPVHTYNIYDQDYTVELSAEGRGGNATISKTITIPPMTSMEKLSGDNSFPEGKKWKLSPSANIIKTRADEGLTTIEVLTPAMLASSGLYLLYNNEFIFRNNGDFIIIPSIEGVAAGLNYCALRHIENSCPSADARTHNLTIADDYKPASGLTYGFTELEDLSIQVADGISSREVTFHGVQTLSISYGGFLGIMDFFREYIVIDITAETMKIACFCSSSTLQSAADYILILTFVPEG